MNGPIVRRMPEGTVIVEWGTIRFRMTQVESRALINELSKVTLMPPRGRASERTEAPQ